MKNRPFIQHSNSKEVSWESCKVSPAKVKSSLFKLEDDTQTYEANYLVSIYGQAKNLNGFFMAPITKYFKPMLTGKTVFGMN